MAEDDRLLEWEGLPVGEAVVDRLLDVVEGAATLQVMVLEDNGGGDGLLLGVCV